MKKAEIYISGIVCYIHVRTFLNQQEWLMQIKQVNTPPLPFSQILWHKQEEPGYTVTISSSFWVDVYIIKLYVLC